MIPPARNPRSMRRRLIGRCSNIFYGTASQTKYVIPEEIGMQSIPFEHTRNPLAHTDAHRGDASFQILAPHLIKKRSNEPSAARAEGMANCDRSAIRVDLRHIQAKFPDHRKALNGKGL